MRVWGLALVWLLGCGADGDSGGAATDGGAGSGSGGSDSSGGSGGSDSSGGSSGSGNAGGGSSCDASEHTGEGTYYDATGAGNCSFSAQSGPLYIAALNDPDYDNAAWCGACAEVTGPDGEANVTVRIVDRCPECASGDLDLSPDAFAELSELSAGRIDISWRFVPCDVPNHLNYVVKDGSNQWWLALQVREHRHPISSLEVQEAGSSEWVSFERQDYNYWVGQSGAGFQLPLSVRVTDVGGNTVEDRDVITVISDFAESSGGSQLPLECGG